MFSKLFWLFLNILHDCEVLKLRVVLRFTVWTKVIGTARMVSISGFVGRTDKKCSITQGLSDRDCIYTEQLKVKHSLCFPSGQDSLQPKFTHEFFYYKVKLSVLCSKKKKKKLRDLWMDLNGMNGFILR